MKRGLVIIAMVACGQSTRPTIEREPVRPVEDARALVAQADALFIDWRADYRRPFERERFSSYTRGAQHLYERACELGDFRACWRALKGDAVIAHCRAGDALSCHALTMWATLPDDVPGAAAREHTNDAAALRRECDAGLPLSCSQYLKLQPDAAIARRLDMLGRDGCSAGSAPDCIALRASWAPDMRLFESLQSCAWWNDCESAGVVLAERGEIVRARDLFERGCQGSQRAGECARLGSRYVKGELPEPVAGRGTRLLTWGCARLGPYDRKTLHCPPLAPPHVRSNDGRALAAQADAYYLTWQPDDARPFNGITDSVARRHAGDLYQHACQLGDPRSCWRAMDVQEVVANCRFGDAMSCHMFADADGPDVDDLPGAAARAYAGPFQRIDLHALVGECDQGLPASCADYLKEQPAAPDASRIRARLDALAREGCRAAILADCSLLETTLRSPETELLSSVEYCRWTLSAIACEEAAHRLADRGDLVTARELRERVCQAGLDETACVRLGFDYLARKVPEPQLGRGRRLVAWGCSRLDRTLAEASGCAVHSAPEAVAGAIDGAASSQAR